MVINCGRDMMLIGACPAEKWNRRRGRRFIGQTLEELFDRVFCLMFRQIDQSI